MELIQGLSQTEFAISPLQQFQEFRNDPDREIQQCDHQIKSLVTENQAECKGQKQGAGVHRGSSMPKLGLSTAGTDGAEIANRQGKARQSLSK